MENPTKAIYYPAPTRPLERAEIQQAFAQFAAGDPIIVAFRQILAERLAAAVVDSTDPRLDVRGAGIAAGRITEIASLQQELANLPKIAK